MTVTGKQDLSPTQSELLLNTCSGTSIRHGFFDRSGGVSQGIYKGLNIGVGSNDNPSHIEENRTRVAHWFGMSLDKIFQPWQIHSADVAIITNTTGWENGSRPKADAIVTNQPGIAIGVITADCGPVLFADPQAGIIAAAHAGWGGAVKGVLEATLQAMVSVGANRSNISACLGPSISQKNYEVGPEFFKRIVSISSDNEKYFKPSVPERPEHHMFDLKLYSTDRLKTAGIKVQDLNICTYREKNNYYSYRRTTHRQEPDYGRQISAIAMTS